MRLEKSPLQLYSTLHRADLQPIMDHTQGRLIIRTIYANYCTAHKNMRLLRELQLKVSSSILLHICLKIFKSNATLHVMPLSTNTNGPISMDGHWATVTKRNGFFPLTEKMLLTWQKKFLLSSLTKRNNKLLLFLILTFSHAFFNRFFTVSHDG